MAYRSGRILATFSRFYRCHCGLTAFFPWLHVKLCRYINRYFYGAVRCDANVSRLLRTG